MTRLPLSFGVSQQPSISQGTVRKTGDLFTTDTMSVLYSTRRAALLVAVLALAGCAFQSSVERTPGAPVLGPSSNAVVVALAPAGAVVLGKITIQGNNWQSGGGCETEALFEAKKIGATHVVVRPAESSLGRGVRCTADAFYVASAPDSTKKQ